MNFASRLRTNVVLLTFLIAYALTTLAGNLIYLTPYSEALAGSSIKNFDIRAFPTADPGYWILLLMPFVVAPPIALVVRRFFQRSVNRVISTLPAIGVRAYLVLCAVSYGYVVFSFYRIGVIDMATRGASAAASAEARFDLLAALGFWPQVALKSILVFLSVYSVIEALLSGRKFWISMAILNVLLMTALLLLLNMKWPAVLFYLAIVLCIVVTESRLSLLILAIATTIVVYLAMTTLVTRFATAQGKTALNTFGTFVSGAVNRMALPYPYYYRTFTSAGPICGTIVDRLERKTSPCQPSTLIYEQIFGKDGFEGRGTMPAAAHITGYALGGWTGALVELSLASIVIGLLAAISIKGVMSATIIVMSGMASYYLSQLPFEATIIYDHGMLWWALLLAVYAAATSITGRWLR
jgi:hypothetical protein